MYCNYRGFSGGMKSMQQEILKFGSYIVDALSKYENPIVSYIGPYSELRGGTWVVTDSKINDLGLIQMFADPTAEGSIMEKNGILGLKYRDRVLYSLMDRISKDILDRKCFILIKGLFININLLFGT